MCMYTHVCTCVHVCAHGSLPTSDPVPSTLNHLENFAAPQGSPTPTGIRTSGGCGPSFHSLQTPPGDFDAQRR